MFALATITLVPFYLAGRGVGIVAAHCRFYAAQGYVIYSGFDWACGPILGPTSLKDDVAGNLHVGLRAIWFGLAAPALIAAGMAWSYPFYRRFGAAIVVLYFQPRLTPWENFDLIVWPALAAWLQWQAIESWISSRPGLKRKVQSGAQVAATWVGGFAFLVFGFPLTFYGALTALHKSIAWLFR